MKKPTLAPCFPFLCFCLAATTAFASGSTNSMTAPAPADEAGSASIIVREQPTATSVAMPLTPAEAPRNRLPYGVEDILTLSHANVNEEVILNYVQSSGTLYNLGPKEIVYLKNEGVSDRVLNTMLDQRKKANETSQAAPQPAVNTTDPAPVATAPTHFEPGLPYATSMFTPIYTPPVVVYEEPTASTLHIIPFYSSGPTFYRSYPRYFQSGSYVLYNTPVCRPYRSFAYRFGAYGHRGGRHHR
jgi:hypothetical protein